MPNRVYALLVGINDYPPEVPSLAGCVNDVDRFHAYLKAHSEPASLAVEVLTNGAATRAAVIAGFRSHLGQAKAGDVALFQYCGHGARWASNAAFRPFFPDGMDEGLVCADSRRPGGYDLSDKELAVLVSELARTGAHVAVLLDSCHSGSGTRGADAFRGLRPRLAHDVTTERPLDTYLDGHYARLRDVHSSLSIPAARHILLAACERGQLAQESGDTGVFTSTLIEVLEKSGGALSYADLFVRCRAAVRSRAFDQDPQFEAYEGFDAYAGFMGRSTTRETRGRYLVSCNEGVWTAECGAVTGVPADPNTTVALTLYRSDAATPVGTAKAVNVGSQRSEIALDFESRESERYVAEVTSLPAAPMTVAFVGDDAARVDVQAALANRAMPLSLVGPSDAARYVLTARDGRLTLAPAGHGPDIAFAGPPSGGYAEAAVLLAPALTHVAQWERSRALQNPRTAMDTVKVEFVYGDRDEGADGHEYPDAEAILDYDGQKIAGRFRVRNRTGQTVHVLLAYFSERYGVHVLRNEPLPHGDGWMTVWGDGPSDNFYLEEGVTESEERFKLIVATEKVDDFLLAQDGLALGDEYVGTRALESVQPQRRKVHTNEWFAKDFRIRIIRRLDKVGVADTSVANGRIIISGHPAVTADISLSSASTAGRGVGSAGGFSTAFERQGMTLLNFSGSRGGDSSVLELTGISNASALKDHPLEITLTDRLGDDEDILPVVYDGQHVLLGGTARKQVDGTTRVSVDSIPEVADQRRSLLGSLKLYFFKVVLKHERVNQLRWVEFKADGTIEPQKSDVAAKVAAARRVLLLVHGIAGDTAGMADCVKACGLDQQFDLVLAYDYENLHTPIAETARELKAQLDAAGVGDGHHLTLLAHSTGGLVARWFVEREGGHGIVDHLVMCGTPNHGSPIGRIDEARKIVGLLTTLAANYLPVLLPHVGFVWLAINGSKKLTPTLEQIHPASEFLRTLNESADPGVPYTILAGDVATYREAGDDVVARLVAKAGRGLAFNLLFAERAHDIVAGVESVFGVGGGRLVAPVRVNVACHHMNYFASSPGQQALKSVAW